MLSCHQIKHSGAIAGVQQLGDHQLQQIVILSGVQQVAEHQVGSGCTSDPYWDDVVLAMHMDGANGSTTFTDLKGHTVTAYGNVAISTAQSKFGGASAGGFSTTYTDRLVVGAAVDLALGSAYTIEGWVRSSAAGAENTTLLDLRAGGGGVFFTKNGTGRQLAYYRSGGLSTSGGTAYPLNQWFHVAFCCNGETMSAYLDGVKQWERVEHPSVSAAAITIGSGYTNDFAGALLSDLDDLRITKNARYTENFEPPTQAFFNN